MDKVPNHIAIIMDGNRRWAEKRKLSALEGHRKGVDSLIRTMEEANRLGIKYVTVYALSTENLKSRSRQEIGGLFQLLEEVYRKQLPRLKSEGIKILFMGNLDALPTPTKIIINKAVKELSEGKNGVLIVALNYGGREEIIRAANAAAEEKIPFTEDDFKENLYTSGIPDPELIIRTGGHQRLSNFLLWQSSYSELFFTDTLWPDFDEKELRKVIEDFKERIRNFGA